MESILAQTYQDFEVILLDDCSPDESRAIISTFPTPSRPYSARRARQRERCV